MGTPPIQVPPGTSPPPPQPEQHAKFPPITPLQSRVTPNTTTTKRRRASTLSKLPGTKIMCCDNNSTLTLHQHSLPPSALPDKEDIESFRQFAVGKNPDRVESVLQPIPWSSYELIFVVCTFASRCSKSWIRTDMYAVSDVFGPELIQIPSGNGVQWPPVLGSTQGNAMEGECLVRVSGGLEFRCRRHLDYIYTLYQVVYKEAVQPPILFPYPIDREAIRASASINSKVIEALEPLFQPVNFNLPPTQNRNQTEIPTPTPPHIPSPNPFPSSPISTPTTTPRKHQRNTNLESTTPQRTASPLGVFQIGEDGKRYKKCSKHKRFLPEESFDINLKTGMLYGHCRSCMGRKGGW
ncbi:hypothetical protein HYALB_00012274 [Hymenoscyphus albidus]|uniref:Uncharacterized protein n=1 Tax=Hymenoscyphus albidus TaxID=595503 RepID=A0A9N9LRI6_9HELO|nr:hypothetical protein HYALB_00012274 [Hymenoscyphus albidus]